MNKNATFSLSQNLLEELDRLAKESRLKKSVIVEIALTEFIQQLGSGKTSIYFPIKS